MKEAPSNKKQMNRSMKYAEIGKGVRADDTTSPERAGTPFAPSVDRVLDKNPGFGKVKLTIESHVTRKGLDTLSSDSRKAPLAGQGAKIELRQDRNYEHEINGTSRATHE